MIWAGARCSRALLLTVACGGGGAVSQPLLLPFLAGGEVVAVVVLGIFFVDARVRTLLCGLGLGLELRVKGSGFRVQGSGLRVKGLRV